MSEIAVSKQLLAKLLYDILLPGTYAAFKQLLAKLLYDIQFPGT